MALQKYKPTLQDRLQDKKDIEKFIASHQKKQKLETLLLKSAKSMLVDTNKDIARLKKK
jgi:hypothetical protein